jgi:hypothetical protein
MTKEQRTAVRLSDTLMVSHNTETDACGSGGDDINFKVIGGL